MTDGEREDLRAFAERTRSLDLEAFLERVPCPHLLVQEHGAQSATAFRTGKVDMVPAEGRAPGANLSLGDLVPVRKSARNAFANLISVGRTPNNDIVLNHPAVSKLHAFFQAKADGSGHSITDSGSSFGTTLDGSRLLPNLARPLESGQVIRFGDAVHTLFLTPHGLFDHIRSLRFFKKL